MKAQLPFAFACMVVIGIAGCASTTEEQGSGSGAQTNESSSGATSSSSGSSGSSASDRPVVFDVDLDESTVQASDPDTEKLRQVLQDLKRTDWSEARFQLDRDYDIPATSYEPETSSRAGEPDRQGGWFHTGCELHADVDVNWRSLSAKLQGGRLNCKWHF